MVAKTVTKIQLTKYIPSSAFFSKAKHTDTPQVQLNSSLAFESLLHGLKYWQVFLQFRVSLDSVVVIDDVMLLLLLLAKFSPLPNVMVCSVNSIEIAA